MSKIELFVQNVTHWSNAISNVAISRQYITEQYDMRSNMICGLLGDILPWINITFAVS